MHFAPIFTHSKPTEFVDKLCTLKGHFNQLFKMTVLKYRKGHQFSAQKEIGFPFLFEKSVACARGEGEKRQ